MILDLLNLFVIGLGTYLFYTKLSANDWRL